LGGNGYIGQAVAIALRQRGYHVSALIRNEAQAQDLLRAEVLPVIGTVEDLSSYRHAVEEASVIIDTVALYTAADPAEANRKLLKLIAEFSKKYNQKKRYIYTSGVLVYGDTNGEVDETVAPKHSVLGWRIKFESEVASNTDVEGVIIRPAFVWGGAGALAGSVKFTVPDGKPTVTGNPDRYVPWVHIHDLADAYTKIVEASGSKVSGQIFNVAAENLKEIDAVIATARATGAKGEVVLKPAGNDFLSQVTNVTVTVSSKKIQRQLGWYPKFGSLLLNADIWYKSYKAWQTKKSA